MLPPYIDAVEDTRNYYLKNIALYGLEAPRTMGYHSGPIDDRLIANILPERVPDLFSVLDVGCGLGQLIPILKSRFPDSEISHYVGLDLVGQFISRCIEQYPQHEFRTENFIEWSPDKPFDLVLAAGVLVTKNADFEGYLENFIARMVAASGSWIGFNVVGSLGASYTAKHLAAISETSLRTVLDKFRAVSWQVSAKEVFPGSLDLFVTGSKAGHRDDVMPKPGF